MAARSHAPTARADALLALQIPGDLRRQSLVTLHLIMAMRFCGLFERAGRDPLVELTRRFRSFTAACAVLDLASLITRSWPEPYHAGRPCCMAMTPDEWTLGRAADAAQCGNCAAFAAALAGFVRADRIAPLYGALVHAAALVEAAPTRTRA